MEGGIAFSVSELLPDAFVKTLMQKSMSLVLSPSRFADDPKAEAFTSYASACLCISGSLDEDRMPRSHDRDHVNNERIRLNIALYRIC